MSDQVVFLRTTDDNEFYDLIKSKVASIIDVNNAVDAIKIATELKTIIVTKNRTDELKEFKDSVIIDCDTNSENFIGLTADRIVFYHRDEDKFTPIQVNYVHRNLFRKFMPFHPFYLYANEIPDSDDIFDIIYIPKSIPNFTINNTDYKFYDVKSEDKFYMYGRIGHVLTQIGSFKIGDNVIHWNNDFRTFVDTYTFDSMFQKVVFEGKTLAYKDKTTLVKNDDMIVITKNTIDNRVTASFSIKITLSEFLDIRDGFKRLTQQSYKDK